MGHDDLAERFSSFGWHVISVRGNDLDELLQAFSEASQTKGKPSVIIANTTKGYGSPVMENKANWHHKVPTQEEYNQIISDFAAGRRLLFMNKIANKQVICQVLMEKAKTDKDVWCCAVTPAFRSMTPFAENYPEQFVEVGIAEQNLVSISAGLAKCGKKAYAVSPACFLSTRSYEQAKVDVAYSNTNVKLIGISGGISYGALGMSHHSAQDIAAMSAVPNMRVYIPSDKNQTKCLTEALLGDEKPAYIRVGRNAVEDVYEEGNCPFEMDKATVVKEGNDVAIVACGEMVKPSLDAAKLLEKEGISAAVWICTV